MKKSVLTLLSAPILMTILIFGINTKASATSMKEVVILGCGASFGDMPGDPGDPGDPGGLPSEPPEIPGYEINNWSNSSGAPAAPSDDSNCAQAIADILNEGFKLQRVKSTEGDLNYIFIGK